jgi:biotin-(acetyl-CoA carboxylase) ligase
MAMALAGRVALPDSTDWRVRKGSATKRFSDRLVVQGGRAGLLDLSINLGGGPTSRRMLGLLRPLVAASTSEGIRRDTGIVSWLYWPDLVTIDDRVVAKTSFSLNELPEPGGKAEVVVGISVNCFSSRPTSFPSALPSTSILHALGVEIDVALLRDKVLHALNWYHAEWARGMHQKLADRIRPTIPWLGHEVEVRTPRAPALQGRAKGIDDFGSLLLEQQPGRGRKRNRVVHPESVDLVRVVR